MTRPPRLLDLFCGAGGCSVGYHRAGFEVVGVDTRHQTRYPFSFVKADAMEVLTDLDYLRSFDVIHASPPCQHYSSATKAWGRTQDHPDMFEIVLSRLVEAGRPWVIENVEGAPVGNALRLCGSMFGLGVQRHRWFETSHLIMSPYVCRHTGDSLTVTGHSPYWWAKGERIQASTQDINAAMGIDWMRRKEIVQAIPPAYTEFLGRQLLEVVAA